MTPYCHIISPRALDTMDMCWSDYEPSFQTAVVELVSTWKRINRLHAGKRNQNGASSIGHATEAFILKKNNIQPHTHRSHIWSKNKKDIINFLLKQERNFEGKTIQELFDSSFFSLDLWELFSSK